MNDPIDLNEYDFEAGNDATNTVIEDSNTVAANHEAATQLEDLGVQDLGVDSEITAIKVRKPIPKLDADRLLNSLKGYPSLLKNVKRLKYRKGEERKYLKKYVMIHQIWANRLWPKANFDDFTMLARRVGKDIRVKAFIREQMEDEKYGIKDKRGEKQNKTRYEHQKLPDQAYNHDTIEKVSKTKAAAGKPSTPNTVEQITASVALDTSETSNRESPELSDVLRSDQDSHPADIDEPLAVNNITHKVPGGPTEEELEAAMELYDDMDF